MLTATLAAMCLCYAGMTALASAMDRHRSALAGDDDDENGDDRDGCGVGTRTRTRMRRHTRMRQAAGALLLALAWLPCAVNGGASIGSAAWCGYLGIGAMLVALTLSYRPALANRLACASAAAGCVLTALILAAPST